MLYDEYKAKLERRRQTFERLWKYRLLILAAVVLVVVVMSVLLGIKGTVYEFSVPETIAYGQDGAFDAASIFGDAQFEFRAVGEEEWSDVCPIYAGKYECRPIGYTVTGARRAGKISTFEILPIPVEVSVYGDHLHYGDDIVFYAELPYGDKLQVNNYKINDIDGRLFVSFEAGDVAAYNKAGEDVTSSYVFTPSDEEIPLERRPILVRMPSGSVEYDGQPHSFADCDVSAEDGLLEGHRVEVAAEDFTEAGDYSNVAGECKIFNADGKDITYMYSVTCVPGAVSVLRRKITVGASPKDIVYDGKAHTYDEGGLLDGTTLAEGHTLSLSGFRSVTHAGSYADTTVVKVMDGERDVTRNYAVTRRFDKLNILPRPVTITTDSASFEYDGAEHAFEKADGDGLAEGHALQVTGAFKATYAGEWQNRPQLRIVDERGANVTSDYAIDYALGTVSVLRRAIEVVTTSGTAYYSGDSNIPADAIENADSLLVGGDSFRVDYGGESMTEANETGYQNAPIIDIVDVRGRSVKDNYDMRFTYGTIVVMRRRVSLSVREDMAATRYVYNGDYQGPDEVAMLIAPSDEDGYGIVGGHTLRAVNSKKLRDVGEAELELSLTVTAYGGEDVTSDYDLTLLSGGNFSITPAHISVRTVDASREYDGTPFSAAQAEVFDLVGGHTFTLEDCMNISALTDADSMDNIFDFTLRVFDGEDDATGNYVVDEVTYGTLTVTPRRLSLRLEGGEFVYSGKPVSVDSVYADRLVSGHNVVVMAQSFTAAGEYDNQPADWRIEDEDGIDVTRNYRAAWERSLLIISKRQISVTTASAGDTDKLYYDGYAHGAASFVVSDKPYGIADGQELVAGYEEWTEAGEYINSPTSWSVVDGGGADVSSNYEATWTYGNVVISKRPIRLRTASKGLDGDVIYDGTPKSADSFETVLSDGYLDFAHGQSMLVVYDRWINVGAYVNIPLEYRIMSATRAIGEVTDNYDITWEYGKVLISKRTLIITPTTTDFVYDGVLHAFYGLNTMTIGGDGAADGQEIEVTNKTDCAFIYAGEHVYTPAVAIRWTADGSYVPEMDYDIQVNSGTITIAKRPISVATRSYDVYYSGDPNVPATVEAAIAGGNAQLKGRDVFVTDYRGERMTNANETGYPNAPIIDIVDDKGQSVKDNYEGLDDVSYGAIIVRRRNVTFEVSGDISLVYNGYPQGKGALIYHTDKTPFDGAKGNGVDYNRFIVSASNRAESTDCGITPLDPKFAIQAGLSDVTDNYNITVQCFGRLIITPKSVSFATGSARRKYNGAPLTCDEVTVSGLVEGLGHTYKHEARSPLPQRIDKGTIKNEFEFEVHIFDGSRDITFNYDVAGAQVTYGELTVTACEIEVTTGSGNFTYDAQPHGVSADNAIILGDGLVKGHRFVATLGEFVDAGTYQNSIDGGIEACKIFDATGADVTFNYTISRLIPGKVVIYAREVTVATGGSKEKIVYDGQPHIVDEPYTVVSELKFVEGHRIVPEDGYDSIYTGFEDAGEHANRPAVGAWKIVDAYGERIKSENYSITWQCGTVSILKRSLTVQLGSTDQPIVYDGQQHRVNTFSITSKDGLVAGQTLEVTCRAFTGVTVSRNTLESEDSYTIRKADGTPVHKTNYNITWLPGAVEITRRPITLRLRDGVDRSWIYDGTCHIVDGSCDVGDIIAVYDVYPRIAGHRVEVTADKFTDAGTHTLKFAAKIYDAGSFDVSANYSIVNEATGEQFVITKRDVVIYTGDNTWVYEVGGKFSEQSYTSAEGLLAGHRLGAFKSTVVTGVTDFDGKIGYVDNTFSDVHIVDAAGKDVTGNYNVSCAPGKLRVKSPVEVYIYSIKKAYDGVTVSLDADCGYKIKTLPPDVRESDVHIQLVGSLTKPGVVTLEQATNDSRARSYVSAEGVNRIDFVGQTNVIEILRQRIIIRTSSVTGADRTKPIIGSDYGYYIVIGKLIGDHELNVKITGMLTAEQDSAINSVDRDSVTITDSRGNDVSDCYEVVFEEGILSWAE